MTKQIKTLQCSIDIPKASIIIYKVNESKEDSFPYCFKNIE